MHKKLFLLCIFSLSAFLLNATNYFVAKSGNDQNSGSWFSPFLTINKAAQIAKGGDSIFIRAGVYREYINPLNGGNSENSKIVYQSYASEKVVIKGSEQITNWQQLNNGIWSCTIPNSFFGNFNPYLIKLKGAFLYGGWQHLGNVFIDDEQLIEVTTNQEVVSKINTWYTNVNTSSTTIIANFSTKNPNNSLTEIVVRKTILAPNKENLSYIEMFNLNFSQAATRWQSPQDGEQDGLVATNGGHHWKIENCYFSHAKCSAISLGIPASGNRVRTKDYLTTGHHVIKNNYIEKCGEAGVCGAGSYASFSIISNNIVDSINYTNEFGGYENSGLKFHNSVDLQILQNQVRNIGPNKNAIKGNGWGIWIDYCNQGTRISGNFITNCYNEALMIECNLGPILIDNNICIGNVFLFGSQGVFAVHNLFIDTQVIALNDPTRLLWYYMPHTIEVRGVGASIPPATLAPGTISAIVKNFKFISNIFINSSLANLPSVIDAISNNNVFYQNSVKTNWSDRNSVEDQLFNTMYKLTVTKDSFAIKFNVNDKVFNQKHPFITRDFIGISSTSYTQQGIETKNGTPIKVDNDFYNLTRDTNNIIAGPFRSLIVGENTFGKKGGLSMNGFPTVLPTLSVQILQFNKSVQKCFINFSWKSQIDTNLVSYVIEKSENSIGFQVVSTIVPRCVTNNTPCSYSAKIIVSDSLKSIYRFKLVYKNGFVEYLFSENIKAECVNNTVEVFPNPVVNSFSILYRNKNLATTTVIRLFNFSGKLLYSKRVNLQRGNNYFTISDLNLYAGNYMITIGKESKMINKL